MIALFVSPLYINLPQPRAAMCWPGISETCASRFRKVLPATQNQKNKFKSPCIKHGCPIVKGVENVNGTVYYQYWYQFKVEN